MRRALKDARLLTAIALAAGISMVARSQEHGAGTTSAASQVMHKERAMMDADVPGAPLRNAFEIENWHAPAAARSPKTPVPAPQTLQAPPPVPVAPPLPFTFMGRYVESGDPVFFLTAGERLLLVHAGDVIDGTYRVEGMVGDALDITYLPLSIKQSVEVGGGGSRSSENQLNDQAAKTAPEMPDN